MKYLLFFTTISLLLIVKPSFSQFKILDDLKKTGEQILKEKEPEQKTNQSQKTITPDTSKPVQNKDNNSPKVQQETQKIPNIPKQNPFSKSFRLTCTYTADGKTTQATYGVDGLNFILNTINLKLGERLDSESGSILVIREGSSNIVKVENDVKAIGLKQTIIIDFDKGRADQLVLPQNRTYIGVCSKI